MAPINARPPANAARMYLKYWLDESGNRQYTMKSQAPDQTPTLSAHPARFSPDDPYSRERVTLHRRYGLLPYQQGESSALPIVQPALTR
jgi:H/ACA ribonucleoprotein complex subunit 3